MQPSMQPSSVPSSQPSVSPSSQPSQQPTVQPSAVPTMQPSSRPSRQPSMQPTTQPSSTPTHCPTSQPSSQPSSVPSAVPTCQPSSYPASVPSVLPSSVPSTQPSQQPITQPSVSPSAKPSMQPTNDPSRQPTVDPTSQPTHKPSSSVIGSRTWAPTLLGVNTVVSNLPVVVIERIIANVTAVKVFVRFKSSTLISGTVYCNALSLSVTMSPSSLLAFVMTGAQKPYLSGKQQEELSLNGLTSVSQYSVYCSVVTSVGSASNESAVRKTQTNVTTICCRTVLFCSTPKYLYNNEIYYSSIFIGGNIFSYKLSSLPETRLSITPQILSLQSDGSYASVQGGSIVPNIQTWFGNSTSKYLTSSFKIVPSSNWSSADSYIVKLVMSGDSASKYTSETVKLTILDAASDPPVPQLTKVLFSDSGDALYMIFDSSTNYGKMSSTASWSCSSLWTFVDSTSCSCVWLNKTTVYAQLTASSTLEVGSSIILNDGFIAASCVSNTITGTSRCSEYATLGTTNLEITAAYNPIVPAVVLTSLAEYTLCSNVTLDASGSTGSGGRNWKSIEWHVLLSNGSVANSVVNFLTNGFSDSSSLSNIIVLPQRLFDNDTYYITLSLTNFLDQMSSETTYFLYGSDGNLPMVKIGGASSLSIKASSSIMLYGYTEVSACSKTTGISYDWFVKDITESSTGSGILTNWKSTSKNPWIFSLPSYCLTSSKRYSILFQATSRSMSVNNEFYNLSSSTSVFVTVLSGNVHAIIAGASVRYISTNTTLDASSSYDDDSNSTDALSFLWTCIYGTGDNYGSSCASAIGWNGLSTDVTASLLFVEYDKLMSDIEYLFTVYVTSTIGTVRTSSTSVTIIKRTLSVPVDIDIVGSTFVVNAGSSFVLDSSITSDQDLSVYWQALISDEAQSNINNGSSLQQDLLYGIASGGIKFPLLISSVQFPPGLELQFRLTVYESTSSSNRKLANTDAVLYSQITVRVNGSPRGGRFVVNPLTGIALSTIFSMVTTNWQDDITDLPLSYDFRYSSDG